MKNKKLLILCSAIVLGLSACAQTVPEDALMLSSDSMQLRQLQTRSFATANEKELLLASAGVLQDMGYTIEESETALGVIVGTKDADATEAGQIAASIFIAALGGGSMPVDQNQQFKASIITKPVSANKTTLRITLQRVVWNTQGQVSKSESIEDPAIYQEFFANLSKAVFLEAHKI